MKPKKSSLLRSGMITAAATFLSRILGMIRDIAIASLLGASLSADIFFFANRIPNFFRRLFAEGAFAQAFVPVMTQTHRQKSFEELRDLISRTMGTLGFIVFLICLSGMLLSPFVTALFGYGWYQDYINGGSDGYKFTQASELLKITFPYLFFITLTALYSSVLNVYNSFLVPAITPCILNISLIAAAYFIAPMYDDKNTVLAFAMVAGGILQLLFHIPFIIKLRLLVLPRWGWRHEGVARIRYLMLPALLGVSAAQLNLLVNTVLASFLATGSISYLYYSDRLLEFPIGIFAVAISTVILPSLSGINFKEHRQLYESTLDWGVRLVLLLGIPSAIGIIVLREPILRVLFMRGEFTSEHVLLSSYSLLASVSGLCAIMLVRVLVQGFAAIQDTRTPVKCSLASIASNIVFNLILIWPLAYIGLALSTALAAFVNAFLLLYMLYRKQIYTISRGSVAFIAKALLAGLVMGSGVRYMSLDFDTWINMSTLQACIYLALYISAGALIFTLCALLLGIRIKDIKR